ncbi:uncharacterized protein LOC116611666 isoform X2 [Nematostella vectensis]|uniref:uncharacterized protein LOC116611666 isoform X2 n=1 Tax=Nematostella vectensis TaxID=45351 RepID=UPI0020778E31|nr:uncharacterized protein LOC116611666 isoform X2 [Nematostella vectensis]
MTREVLAWLSIYCNWLSLITVLFLFSGLNVSSSLNSSYFPTPTSLLSSGTSIPSDKTPSINSTTTSTIIIISSSSNSAPVTMATMSPTAIMPTTLGLNTTNATSNTTGSPWQPNVPTVELSIFSIIMISLGGLLIVVMTTCLFVICCRGRERGPGAAHTPHTQVKLKPWKMPDLSSTNADMTDDAIEPQTPAANNGDHPNSFRNDGPSPTSPSSPNHLASANNNLVTTPTGTFRRDLDPDSQELWGDYGRKLSLGQKAYEQNSSTDENTLSKSNTKGVPDDLERVHFV